MKMKQLIEEKIWYQLSFAQKFKDYEELVMDAFELPEKTTSPRQNFYAVKDTYFDGNTKEFYQFIKNNSLVVRTARVSGEMIVSGEAVVEMTEDQYCVSKNAVWKTEQKSNSAEDIDWSNAVCDPDDLDNVNYGEFIPDGDTSITQNIEMIDYSTYLEQFAKDAELQSITTMEIV